MTTTDLETPVQRRVQVKPYCHAKIKSRGRCPWKPVMKWYGIPFCATHCPPHRTGCAGWTRLI